MIDVNAERIVRHSFLRKRCVLVSIYNHNPGFVVVHAERVLILDFGSQYTQLIARKVRESGVYAEIHPFNLSIDKIRAMDPVGIILSGGPASIYAEGAP